MSEHERPPTHGAPVGPVAAGERIDTLDVLRGFALLGILLVNIELFRGADLYVLMVGEAPALTPAEQVVQFVVGWLVGGKFISSFALLFGVGAAIMGGRLLAAGRSPRGLLARRYVWLAVFGLAHMLLLFAGDILFVYAIAGLLLLPFVFLRPRALLWWAGGIVAVLAALLLLVSAVGLAVEQGGTQGTSQGAVAGQLDGFFEQRRDQAVEAYTTGGLGEQVQARAWEAAFVQSGQLLLVPWVLALFLVGFAIGKAGVVGDLAGHRRLLRRVAGVGLSVGLVLNLPLGLTGTLGAAAVGPDAEGQTWVIVAVPVLQVTAAPLLGVGYLAALALLCLRPGVVARLAPLRDAGRMALTGYVLQSVLATGFFVGLGFYDRISSVQALGVVAVIWALLLAISTLWQRRLGRGPLERAWRRVTYGAGR